MTGYLVRRSGWACVLLLVITLYTFVLFFMIPSTPQVIGGARVTPEPLAGRYEFGLHLLWASACSAASKSPTMRVIHCVCAT